MNQALWADLHIHSTCSDGLLSPSEVVRTGQEAGLSAVSIVDHDTIQGLGEATEAGKRFGVEVLPGVELSSQINGKDVHIIGYGFE
ncbi:MAG TPA: PHP domain-containing protein, partial [bacterium]